MPIEELYKILERNGYTTYADTLREKLEKTSSMYAGYVSESFLGDVLAGEDLGAPSTVDIDDISFQLYAEHERTEGIPKGTHNLSDLMSLETERFSKAEKTTRDEAEKFVKEEMRSRLSDIAFDFGPTRALELKQTIFGKERPRNVPPIKKKEKHGYFFEFDTSEFNELLNELGTTQLLKKEDWEEIKDIIFAKDILSQVGQAVQDALIEEYLEDNRKLSVTAGGRKLLLDRRIVTAYSSLLFDISNELGVCIGQIEWFQKNVLSGKLIGELRAKLASRGVTERIDDLLGIFSVQFDKFRQTLYELSLEVNREKEEIKIYENKYEHEYLQNKIKSTLTSMKEQIDPIVSGIKSFISRMEGGNEGIISGTSLFTGISMVYMRLKNISNRIFQFEHGGLSRQIEEVEFKAGVAKLNTAYDAKTKISGDTIDYIFSVSDRVSSALSSIGIDENTIEVIRATISNYVFGREFLVSRVSKKIEEKILSKIK